MKGISNREFAKREDCDEKLVRRKIISGHLIPFADGTLDPALVGTDWRKRTYKARAPKSVEPDHPAEEDEVLAKQAKSLVDAADDNLLTTAEAERKKANYAALRAELIYNREAEQVVAIQDIADVVVSELTLVRNALLSIPTKLAHRIILVKSAEEARGLIAEAIDDALQNLQCDVKQR